MIMTVKPSKSWNVMNNDEFFAFCQENNSLRIERNRFGQILINMPTGSKTGNKNAEIIGDLIIWNRQTKKGYVFDSSTGFTLPTSPKSSVRSPDASWIDKARWEQIPANQQIKFAPICPDFVIELLSETDDWGETAEKMQEYVQCGCQLAWLIDTENQRVMIYRTDGSTEEIQGFQQVLSGETVLTGFEFDLRLLL
jgi:Uma2 family endonuclease